MPVLKTFRGKPLTRVQRLGTGKMMVTYANAASGDKHKREEITEEDWQRHGDSRFVEQMPDLRSKLARG